MCGEVNRYFIELQSTDDGTVPRYRETEMRRALAAQFLETIEDWLNDNDMADKVAAMAITALGQVQITCEPDVINQIRSIEDLNVAAIRQGSLVMEAMRWNEARADYN